MKTEKVKYTAQFENGRIVAQWIGIDGSPENGETPDEVFLATVNQVNKWYQQTNPENSLPGQQGPPIMVDRSNPVAALIADIYSCQELNVLVTYRLLIKDFPEAQSAYNQKFNELNSKSKVILP